MSDQTPGLPTGAKRARDARVSARGAANPQTIRTHLEAIRERHYKWPNGSDLPTCAECTDAWPCPDNADAVAALDLLSKSKHIDAPRGDAE